jgi:hypothetical protein
LSLANLSTKRQRIAELAMIEARGGLSALQHVIDLELLKEAFRLTRKDDATGIDGVTAADYAQNERSGARSANLGDPEIVSRPRLREGNAGDDDDQICRARKAFRERSCVCVINHLLVCAYVFRKDAVSAPQQAELPRDLLVGRDRQDWYDRTLSRDARRSRPAGSERDNRGRVDGRR